MCTTTPNKETVRRISLLNGASYCYLLVSSSETYTHVLLDIDCKKTDSVAEELEAWCGMKFKVYSAFSKTINTAKILEKGEKILPIKLS